MQGKGIIKFFIILLTLACLYSLSFTFVTRKVEKDAVAYAQGDAAREQAYLDSVADLPVFNLGFTKFTYQECKEREIALGLDLKGGMNVTMEISLQELVANLAENPKDEQFAKVLQQTEVRTRTSQDTYIQLFGEEYAKVFPNKPLADFFATKNNAAHINPKSSNQDVLRYLETEANSAVDRSFNILRTRIDRFGVASPNIQKQQGSNRILIELPGVKDEDRVRKLLQGTAELEFWETYANIEIYPMLENIDRTLASIQNNKKQTETTDAAVDTTAQSDAGTLAGLRSGTDSTQTDSAAALNNLANSNPLFAVMIPAMQQMPNGQTVLSQGPVIGYVAQKDTAKVNAYLSNPEIASIIPNNVRLAWSYKPTSKEEKLFELYALKPSTLDGGPAMSGSVVTDASADFDLNHNPMVRMEMNSQGAREWRRVTAQASADPNNKQAIAIVLDNVVYSAPTVQDEIANGSSSITGRFQIEDTQDLANILKAGRLPAPAKIVEEAIVGPTLGQAAIDAGIDSSVIGLVVVLIFMVFYYNRAGLVANIAVIFNVFFLMGILASIGAVLTLPGIAGIVLTMGSAVDANVLIYERIREELAAGKSMRQVIADGYKHAMPSILDSQITTFLVGVILYVFGSGPIAGFATTLMIGIITSLFTSIFISRIIFEWMLEKDWKITVAFPWSDHTMKNANFGFIKHRKKAYAFSIILTVIAIGSMLTKGFSYGVDFSGGRTYVVHFTESVNLESVRDDLNAIYGENTEVKTFGGDDQLRITTPYLIERTDTEADNEVLAKLNEGLAKAEVGYEITSSQKVGPTIANDIKVSAVYAVIFAIIGIGLYILFRFRKWQYSAGAALALAHDAIVLMGIFSLLDGILPFSMDVDQHFIAAILTVVGYSINDTVVVYDRIREYLGLPYMRNKALGNIFNDAINRTLSRTIITSLTVLFVLLVLFIFGGEVIRGFSFAILIGVAFGTYSSIFIAAPVTYDLQGGKMDEESAAAAKPKLQGAGA